MAQQERQHPDGRLLAGHTDGAIDEGAIGIGVAQPEGAHGGPGEQAEIVGQLVGALDQRHRLAHQLRAPSVTLTAEDQGHALGDGGEEGDPAGWRPGRPAAAIRAAASSMAVGLPA